MTVAASQLGGRVADAPLMSGWEDCEFCAGERGCPRASSGSRNCTASQCCKALTAARKREAAQALDGTLAVPALSTASVLPRLPPVCVEIIEVLGVRECNVDELGPRSFYNGPEDDERCTSYKIHGKFGADVDIQHGVPGIAWIALADLLQWFPNEADLQLLDEYEEALHAQKKEERRALHRAAGRSQRQRRS